MTEMFTVDAHELDELAHKYQAIEGAVRHIVMGNVRSLAETARNLARVELEDVRYTGALDKSFTVSIAQSNLTAMVYPTAAHRMYVRMGTRPHWAPIGPLKRWAAVKLGDENAAYAVQRSIAEHGTSVYQLRKRGDKANPWPARVLARADFNQVLRMAAEATGEQVTAELIE